MFDFVQKNKTAAQVLLGVVSLGLMIGVGMGGYDAIQGGDGYLAKVGDSKITPYDFHLFTNGQPIPDAEKASVLEQLVQERLLVNEGKKIGLAISDAELAALIARSLGGGNEEEIKQRYKQVIESRRMTTAQYDDSVRKDVQVNQLLQPIFAAGFVSNASLDLLNRILGETRQVSLVTMPAQDYLAKVTVNADEVAKYYAANQAQFKSPEAVKLEYLVLNQDKIAAAVQVSDDEVQKYFDEHRSEFAKEERKIRLIQLNHPANAKAEDKDALRKNADAVLQQVKKAPAEFANVAKQKSQDPISAPNGGDLGYLVKGMSQNAAFDAAAFKLGKGQISDLIESPQGFSILMVEDIKSRQLADVRPDVEARLKAQKVQAQLKNQVEELKEILFQDAGSLKSAAEKFQLAVQSSDWISRKGGADAMLNNPKLLTAVFEDDVLKAKHNSDPVEVASGVYVAARVAAHRLEQLHKVEEVKPQIEEVLKREKASALVKQDGEAKLKQLQTGAAPILAWSPSQPVRQDLSGQAKGPVKEIFKVDASKLPAYVGAEVPGQGYLLVRIDKVDAAPELTAQSREQLAAMLQSQLANREALAYLDALKTQFKVAYPAGIAKQTAEK